MFFFPPPHLILGGLLNAEDLSEYLFHAVRLCVIATQDEREEKNKKRGGGNKAVQWMLK